MIYLNRDIAMYNLTMNGNHMTEKQYQKVIAKKKVHKQTKAEKEALKKINALMLRLGWE